MEQIYHKEAASGRWYSLTLAEQMGHIGSEVSRAARKQGKHEQLYERAVDRAFELLDLTINDSRWRFRLKELVRVREILADAVLGGQAYNSHLADLDNYFLYFALMARNSSPQSATDTRPVPPCIATNHGIAGH